MKRYGEENMYQLWCYSGQYTFYIQIHGDDKENLFDDQELQIFGWHLLSLFS